MNPVNRFGLIVACVIGAAMVGILIARLIVNHLATGHWGL